MGLMKMISFKGGCRILFITLIVVGACAPLRVCAQRVLERSEKLRPAWLANKTSKPGNATFHYQITEGEHRNLQDARHSAY